MTSSTTAGGDTTTSGTTSSATDQGTAGAAGASFDGPALEDLVVEGARAPQQPEFDPLRLRYSVIAQESPDTLVVTATANSEFTITVSGLAVESGEPVELTDVEPGSEFEVRVSDGDDASRTYTVLYLPSDFPKFTVTVRKPAASSAPIYITPRWGDARFAVKLDNYGVPLFYRRIETPAGANDFKKHWNGVMSYYAGAAQILLDSDYQETSRITMVGDLPTNQHEFRILPNGNYALVSYVSVKRDLSSVGGPADGEVVDGILQEVSPEGDLLFEWNTSDHFSYDGEADYAHVNAIDFDDEGDWIVSMRNRSQVIKIDRATGDVVWKLGGATSDFEFLNDSREGICLQHSVSLLDNGHILLFDNGGVCADSNHGSRSRVAEYALDEEEMTAELVWSYDPEERIYASIMGSAQRLPNGNTLVGWGGAKPHVATEVDADGNVVLDIEGYGPDGEIVDLRSYRAQRFEE